MYPTFHRPITSYIFGQGPPPAYPACEAPPVYDPPPPYPGSPDGKSKVQGHDGGIGDIFILMINQEEVNDEEASKEGKVSTVRE